ncbi:hypothetical protein [Picosynechococcus sp. PCC 8807]|uniref:hypothetical protein n=1 Tax=Picosynechococcus sp. PCC 8807 TaxID=195248 RepID=UPI0008103B74|nr:hypothetical protein [Picosynechococcus sp. PCC 8807]ANV92057.1 hypothetical protein AWQ24_14860 [Picosynechococcus sp. PCC 8807]
MAKTYPPIPDDAFIYRAVSYDNFITDDGKIATKAFLRRFKPKTQKCENYPSAGLTVEDTLSRLNYSFGIIRIQAKDLREFGLDAVQDKADHVSLTNFPHPYEEKQKAIRIARKLAKKAKIYTQWSKEESLKIKTGDLDWQDFIVEA